jgi:hypothetical protein
MAEKALHTLIWSVVTPAASGAGSLQDQIKADFDKIKTLGTGPIEMPTKNYYRAQIQDFQGRLDQLRQGQDVTTAGLPPDQTFTQMEQMMERALDRMRRSLAIAPEADGMSQLTP